MINYLIRLAICAVLVYFIPQYLPSIQVKDIQTAFIVAITMSLLNTFVRPIISLFAIPITLLTLGLFSFVISLMIVYLCAYLVPGFKVTGIIEPILFSIVLSISNSALSFFQKKSKK